MPIRSSIRTTAGRGRLYESVIDTVGDTPAIRINNLGVAGRTISRSTPSAQFPPA
jgi:cysteine synthase